MNIIQNKRGNFLDWFYILAILLMTGVVLMSAFIIITKVDETDLFSDDDDAQIAISSARSTLLSFDNLMLFVIIGLSVFVLVSSALVYNHPAFFIAGFFLLMIAVVVAAMMSNAWWDFANADTLTATTAQFPKILFLMNNLPLYIAFMGIAASIAAYLGYKA